MPADEKKGITVKIDADLHAEVRQYLEANNMTMAEFVTLALQDELHPKIQMKEGNDMEKTRTLAFQVPEDLFQKIKDYLQRNNMTQKEFMIRLIENELERDLTVREGYSEAQSAAKGQDEEVDGQKETTAATDFEDASDEDEEIGEDEEETEDEGMTLSM